MAFMEYAIVFCLCFWFGFKTQRDKDRIAKEEKDLKEYLKEVFEDDRDVKGSF